MQESSDTAGFPSGQRPRPSLAIRLLRLGLACLVLALIIHATPFLVRSFAPLREYARVVEETGIRPGALYYSDVPQTVDGEFNNRDAIRFRVGKHDEPGR